MTKSIEKQPKDKEKQTKRRYVRPRLIEYGSVAKLTASGGTSTIDGTATKKPFNPCL